MPSSPCDLLKVFVLRDEYGSGPCGRPVPSERDLEREFSRLLQNLLKVLRAALLNVEEPYRKAAEAPSEMMMDPRSVPEDGSENRGVRVLVVDDHQPFADLLVAVLWHHGYKAPPAYNAEEALSAAEVFAPHAGVLDVLLPDGNGFEEAERSEQRFPACRVLLTSAWNYESEPE